jgi:hypothetical protein
MNKSFLEDKMMILRGTVHYSYLGISSLQKHAGNMKNNKSIHKTA